MPSPLSPAPAWSKTGSTTTWTVRDPDGHLLAIRVGTTSTPSSATTYAPFTDNLGNVRAMTTLAGTTPAAAYTYSAYGYTLSASGTLTQPYRWGQGYTDDATGLIKLGVRYYDPTHGRFTQQDPTGQDKYAYSYANNCASTSNDPLGSGVGEDISDTLQLFGACFDGAGLTIAALAAVEPIVFAATGIGGLAFNAIAAVYGCGVGIALEGATGGAELDKIFA